METARKSAAKAVFAALFVVVSLLAVAPAASAAGSGPLTPHGGPIMHSSSPYLIFWDPSGHIPASSRNLLTQYLTDLSADSGQPTNAFEIDQQYTEANTPAWYDQQFNPATQVINDNRAFPTTGNCTATAAAYPTCLTTAQIRTEIATEIAARGLPADGAAGSSAFPDHAPVYFVVTPYDVNVCASSTVCSSTGQCFTDNLFTDSDNNQTVLYGTVPMFFSFASGVQNGKNCQRDGWTAVQAPHNDWADIAISSLSAAYHGIITDPLGTGWYNDTDGTEAEDECSVYTTNPDPANGGSPNAWGYSQGLGGDPSNGTAYDETVNGHHYYVQAEWSNGDGGCEVTPTPGGATPAFTVSGGQGTSLTFNPTGTVSNVSYTLVYWLYGDNMFDREIFSPGGGQGLLTFAHTYSAPGDYTATEYIVTANGRTAQISHTVTVGRPPVATFGATPAPAVAGSSTFFNAAGSGTPNTGASVASYTWNFGDGSGGSGPTIGHAYASPGTYTATLTVTDTAGYTASISHQVTVSPTGQYASLLGTVVHGPTVAFTIFCHGAAGQACAVAATAQTNGPVGSGAITVPAGASRTLTITLNHAATALLAKSKGYRMPATVTFTGSQIPAQSVTFAYPRVLAQFGAGSLNWAIAGGKTAVRAFSASGLPHGAAAQVQCIGRGCPFGASPVVHAKGGKVAFEKITNPGASTEVSKGVFGTYKYSASAGVLFGGARLAVGTHVVLKVTAPGHVGEVVTFTIGGASEPRTIACLPPGAHTPQRCR